jgi:hypothetical protein
MGQGTVRQEEHVFGGRKISSCNFRQFKLEMPTMRRCSVIVSLIAAVLFGANEAQSAASVALGVTADGKLKWGFAAGGKATEEQTKSRAIGFCMASGGMKPRIIASTSRRGFGVIMEYQKADGKAGYTASVGAATQQDAINEAARKAKAAGGRKAAVVRSWNDIPQTVFNL